ncbi:hypothetical protein LOAG_09505 [Loa loa]|nr:hypothetical protein LOAG_09505 [Loa loa]EFO18991.2 hypothetical protein LOAG_09505 [Loa loa]
MVKPMKEMKERTKMKDYNENYETHKELSVTTARNVSYKKEEKERRKTKDYNKDHEMSEESSVAAAGIMSPKKEEKRKMKDNKNCEKFEESPLTTAKMVSPKKEEKERRKMKDNNKHYERSDESSVTSEESSAVTARMVSPKKEEERRKMEDYNKGYEKYDVTSVVTAGMVSLVAQKGEGRKMAKDKNYKEKVLSLKKAVAFASLLTSVGNAKTTQSLSVSSGNPSKSLPVTIQRSKRIAEQTTFLAINETEVEKGNDENELKMGVDERKSCMSKQKDVNNDNVDDDDESIYFSTRSTNEMHNHQISDDESIYFIVP